MDDSVYGVLKGFLQIGIFIGGTGFLLALTQPRDSGEFVLSVCSGMIGLTLIIGVILVLRVLGRRAEKDNYDDAPPA